MRHARFPALSARFMANTTFATQPGGTAEGGGDRSIVIPHAAAGRTSGVILAAEKRNFRPHRRSRRCDSGVTCPKCQDVDCRTLSLGRPRWKTATAFGQVHIRRQPRTGFVAGLSRLDAPGTIGGAPVSKFGAVGTFDS